VSAAKTIEVDGVTIAVGRREVKTGKGGPRIVCPACGKAAPVSEWYTSNGGTRLFSHKPCEAARKQRYANPKATAKKPAPKATAKPAARRPRIAKEG
jgi:hypothetical protein